MPTLETSAESGGIGEWDDALRAVEVKCALLAEGVRVDPKISTDALNLSRQHLYDYSMSPASGPIPYEVILSRLPSFEGRPIIVRVRHNENSGWELTRVGGREVLHNLVSGQSLQVELPRVNDFRGYSVMGRDLSTVAQRLGFDLVGVVPTNYCSYYSTSEKCGFCEIVETFGDRTAHGPYRKTKQLILAASEMAVTVDPSLSCITYNGGQLADYDATVRMYVNLVQGLRSRNLTRQLNATIACMPPNDLSLIDDLHRVGLNQLFLNIEVADRRQMTRIAPAKARFGLDRMYDAMVHAQRSFGTGYVYSNLVYGVQTLNTSEHAAWSGTHEVDAMLAATAELLQRGVVPTYTVYHTSGRNWTGSIPLTGRELFELTQAYGELVWSSQIVARERGAVLFTIGSLPNTTYNDGWILAELHNRATADQDR